MTLGRADRALHDRKFIDSSWRKRTGPADHHRHVEMVLEQVRGFDRLLIAAVNQNDAFAGESNEGTSGSARPRLQATPPSSVRHQRPADDQPAVSRTLTKMRSAFVLALPRYFGEQWRFLCAANGQRRAGGDGGAKALEFGAAQLTCVLDFRAAAAAPHRADIERHRVLARAKNNGLRAVGHFVPSCRANLPVWLGLAARRISDYSYK